MRIGIVIGRIGGEDGVALETTKWIEVLRIMGHEVFTISGLYEDHVIDEKHDTCLPVLSFFSAECQFEQLKAFFCPESKPTVLLERIEKTAKTIANSIIKWIRKRKIDVLLSENASALPSHLSMAVGIKKAVKKTGIKTITHDHDFHWEREDRYLSQHKEINQLVEAVFPLKLPNVTHAVINQYAQKTLKNGYDLDSVVIPNVMDFNKPYGKRNEFNKTFRKDFNLSKDDILLFQVTRIVMRKGIETAIRLVHKLEDKRVKLIITGSHADDAGDVYYSKLLKLITKSNLRDQIIFAEDRMRFKSRLNGGGKKLYSLSDAYANARACTYFSKYEGFGNAFVEAVLAKKPIFVNNYKPIFMPDIGIKGFKVVKLENGRLTEEAVHEVKEIICNKELNRDIGEFNYKIGKRSFSYEVLEEKLETLLG